VPGEWRVVTLSVVLLVFFAQMTLHMLPGRRKSARYCEVINKSSAVAEMHDRGHSRHGTKRGGLLCPFAGAGTPSSTMWPGLRSTSVPSGMPNIGWGWVCPFFWG